MKLSRARQLIDRYETELRSRKIDAIEPAFQARSSAAVFVLFTVEDEQAKVVLMRRPRERGRHRGEWAFPGGVREKHDGNLRETAFRETDEELGIPREAINYWGALEPVKTMGTQFEVWPFTGWVDPGTEIIPSDDEVDEVKMFPLETFTSVSQRRSIYLRRNGIERNLSAYAHEGNVVWGATARILGQIFDENPTIETGTAEQVSEVQSQ